MDGPDPRFAQNRYTNIPRDMGRCHDQCGVRSGSPQESLCYDVLVVSE